MRSQIIQVQVVTSDTVVLPPNPDRRELLITPVSTPGFVQASLLVAFGRPATNGFSVLWGSGNTLAIFSSGPLTIRNVGEQIKLEVHMATSASNMTVSILEAFE